VSFKTEDLLICESCFVDGFGKHRVKFILLTNEEAGYKRSQQLELNSSNNALKFHNLKMQHDFNLRINEIYNLIYS
jgi:hypothetical protein